MIPAATVQLIKDTLRIEEVVGDYVNLKRRGSNLIGLCPLHGEKSPSFNVNPARGIFKCFGCGEGGDAIAFLQKLDGLDYVQALRQLAGKYNITIEEAEVSAEVRAEHQRSAALQLVNDYARDFYHKQLTDTDDGKSIGLSYFKHRGYSDETIAKFELGFAPPSGDALKQATLTAGYQEPYLKDLGLITKDGRRDFLRDRVVFPIHSVSGKVVAFAGRILKKNDKAPKYLNSPETELYDKSSTLYGLHLAKQSIRRQDLCLITEGYADVIALYQAGVRHVVATSGTSLTAGHIRLIKRLTQRVVFLYDGDKAGIKAALRGLDLVLAEGMEVKLVLLPDSHDPDSYVKEFGGEAFERYIDAEAKDFIAYKSDLVLAEAKDDPLQRARLVQDVLRTIALVPDVILRTEYVRTTGERFAIDESTLVQQLNQYLDKNLLEEQRRASVAARNISRDLATAPGTAPTEESPLAQRKGPASPVLNDEYRERDVIAALIQFGDEIFHAEAGYTVGQVICAEIEEVLDSFDEEVCGLIANEAFKRVSADESISPAHWTGHERDDVKSFAATVLTSPHTYSPGWKERFDIILTTQKAPEDNWERTAERSIRRFKLSKLLDKLDHITERMRQAQTEGDQVQVTRLLKRYISMEAVKRQLADQLGSVVLR